MSTEFDPKLAEFVARGQTATLILDAIKLLVDGCIEQVIKRIMQAVNHGNLTEDKAVGLCHEIAAFRRLISVQQGMISQGEAASARLREAPWPNSST